MSYTTLDIIKSYTLKEVMLNIFSEKKEYYGMQVGDNVIINGTLVVPNAKIQEVFDETTNQFICYNLVPNTVVTEYREPSYINVKSEPIVTSAPKEVEQPKVEKTKSKEKSE